MSAVQQYQQDQNELIIIEPTPLVTMLEAMRRDEQSYLHNAKARAELRHALWINTMLDEARPIGIRLKASELSGKADGAFVEKTQVGITNSFRDMIMSLNGQVKELAPLTEDALQCIDGMESVEELTYQIIDDEIE